MPELVVSQQGQGYHDERHKIHDGEIITSATIAYNAFDDRLFVTGRNGAPDGFEQTRHSINATYFFYPTDNLTVQLKASNLLDDPISIERAGVETLNEKVGRTFSLSVQWELY